MGRLAAKNLGTCRSNGRRMQAHEDGRCSMKVLRAHDFQAEHKKLVDVNELSHLLSIPKGTLYNLVYQRRIPFVKCGRSLRFDAVDVIQSLPHFGTIGSAGNGRRS
jgi:excisionase family DNA binding protein